MPKGSRAKNRQKENKSMPNLPRLHNCGLDMFNTKRPKINAKSRKENRHAKKYGLITYGVTTIFPCIGLKMIQPKLLESTFGSS